MQNQVIISSGFPSHHIQEGEKNRGENKTLKMVQSGRKMQIHEWDIQPYFVISVLI